VGDACIGELRRHGVNTALVRRQGERLGLYYLEAGADQRPSRVIYDRRGSALATARREDFDWAAILHGATWLHASAITAAISESATGILLDAVRTARALGVTVSFDYNHRATLWRDGRDAPAVLRPIMEHVDVGIAGREDCTLALGIAPPARASGDESGITRYVTLADAVLDAFPQMRLQAITLREGETASRNAISALLRTREATLVSRRYEMEHIVDRIGSGDAFAAGLIHGLLTWHDEARALEFAVAACCLKHSVPGDVSRATVEEVESLVGGASGGRVQR
jgi:2-dehydro-3-deoxygluconokinase